MTAAAAPSSCRKARSGPRRCGTRPAVSTRVPPRRRLGLWRRLARHAPLTTSIPCSASIAAARPAVELMDRYYGEIDALPPEKAPGATPLPPENGARPAEAERRPVQPRAEGLALRSGFRQPAARADDPCGRRCLPDRAARSHRRRQRADRCPSGASSAGGRDLDEPAADAAGLEGSGCRALYARNRVPQLAAEQSPDDPSAGETVLDERSKSPAIAATSCCAFPWCLPRAMSISRSRATAVPRIRANTSYSLPGCISTVGAAGG